MSSYFLQSCNKLTKCCMFRDVATSSPVGIVIHSEQGYLSFWSKVITPSRLRQAKYTKVNYINLTTLCLVSYELQCLSPALKRDGPLVVGVHSLHVCAKFVFRLIETTRCIKWLKLQ